MFSPLKYLHIRGWLIVEEIHKKRNMKYPERAGRYVSKKSRESLSGFQKMERAAHTPKTRTGSFHDEPVLKSFS